MLGPIVIRAAPLLRSSRRSGFHNFSAMTPSAIGTTEARPRRRYREGARPSRRSCQWGNESSSNSACLVITFLTDRNCAVRRVPVGWFVREVKSVFARARARAGLVTGRVPRSGAPRSSSSIKGHRPGNEYERSSLAIERGETTRLSDDDPPRRGLFHRERDIVVRPTLRRTTRTRTAWRARTRLSARAALPISLWSRPHTYSPFSP